MTEPVPPVAERSYDGYERPGLVIAYHVGPYRIAKGILVGLNEEGLLVPILKAVSFVGIANEARAGVPEPVAGAVVNVTVVGSFVLGFAGWKPTFNDLQRKVWAVNATTVAGAPLRTDLEIGRIIGLETTSDGRPGVRVKIDEAAARCLPPLPGRVETQR